MLALINSVFCLTNQITEVNTKMLEVNYDRTNDRKLQGESDWIKIQEK